MAKVAVAQHGVAISLACTEFGISETCYRYQAKRLAENEEITNPADGQQPQLGIWSVLPVLAQGEGIWLESQTDLSDLPDAGTEPAHQAEETHGAGEAGNINGTGIDQPGLVHGFHA